jgi:nucleoside-diphosphate-sugar epimerase
MASERVVCGEISEQTRWDDVVGGVDTVVHLAARRAQAKRAAGSGPDALSGFRAVNVQATEGLARAAARAGVPRFIFVSTAGVHGMVSTRPIREDDPFRPWSPYTVSKLEAERALRQVATETGLGLIIVRPPLIYGAGRRGGLGRLLQLVQRGVPLPFANARNRRSLVSLDNVVDLLVRCVRDATALGEAFLVSDGHDVSTVELIQKLAAVVGRSPRLFPLPVPAVRWVASAVGRSELAARVYDSFQLDISKVVRLLGWKPPCTLEQGLRRIASSDRQETRART